ncbi:MAG: hypothetical protein RLZZ420_1889, partial [Bacteroidota bacterium]
MRFQDIYKGFVGRMGQINLTV